jgi:predicted Zn-dependent peptidase
MNVSQSRLNIGLTSGVVMSDEEYYAMSLFNEIFGGSSVAKLFMNVREKQSLCYYCYSSYSSATGTLMIGCGIKKENREKAYVEIEKQLSEMQLGNFDENEINAAKRTIISGILQMSDNPSAIEAFKFRRFLAGVSETAEEAIERVNKVTCEEIIAVAGKVKFDSVYFLCGEGEEEEEYDE